MFIGDLQIDGMADNGFSTRSVRHNGREAFPVDI
jgi:hypothetical protein